MLSSAIHAVEGDTWEIRTNAFPRHSCREEIRGLLWKAITFADERAAEVYDNHEDDLTRRDIVSLFSADLVGRGLPSDEPTDPFRDPEWANVLAGAYMGAH